MNSNPQNEPNKKEERREPKPRKRITPTYLHNSGLYYLQRFSASSKHFREVMLRKVKKSCMVHEDQDYESCAQMVDALVKKFQQVDILNDEVYTKNVVTSLRRSGKSRNAIMLKLRSKGVSAELSTRLLQDHDQERSGGDKEAEMTAAVVFARKKRFGPFTRGKDIAPEKILASMARAGFKYEICKTVLKMDLEDAENRLLRRP